MAARKPLVIISGQTQQLPAGDTLDAATTSPVELSLTNADSVTVPIGTPIYISGSAAFQRARANAGATTRVAGLVATTSIAASASGVVAMSGPLVATSAQWDTVTGQTGGLTAGAAYFLDAATAGKLTTVVPSTSGQYVASVGTAIDTVTMMISVDPTILL